VRDVSGVANAVNISPGGVMVKSVLKVRAQGGQTVKTLGVVEVDDQQAGALVDEGLCVEAIPARLRRFQRAGTLKQSLNPGGHGLAVRETPIQFLHAPDYAAAPLEAQVWITIAAEQKKNSRSPGGEGHKIDPARRQRGVHGQDTGMAKEEPVDDGPPPVLLHADPVPHVVIMGCEISKILNQFLFRGNSGIAKHAPRSGMRQEQIFRRNAALQTCAAKFHFRQDVAAQAHLYSRSVNAKDRLGVRHDPRPPAFPHKTQPVAAQAQLPPFPIRSGLLQNPRTKRSPLRHIPYPRFPITPVNRSRAVDSLRV
jgi:hypothetical protein